MTIDSPRRSLLAGFGDLLAGFGNPPARFASLLLPASALLAAALATPAAAQAPVWPVRTVKLLVGSPPGGPSDMTARLFADALSKRSGQSVVVENRPGAGNNLAAGVAATATPDGYTLVLSPDTVRTVNPLVYGTQSFDARRDLVPVSILATFSQMLVCNPAAGLASAEALVAKANSTRLTYASGGPGVPGHLAAEMFLQVAGTKMDHVPYRGPAPATMGVLSHEVDCGFLATPTVIPHVKAGKLVALAVSAATPSPLAPEVPPLAKALNKPELDMSFRLVLETAAGTPAPVLAAIEQAAVEIMKAPELAARLRDADLVAVGSSSARAQQELQAEIVRWEPLVRRLNLTAK